MIVALLCLLLLCFGGMAKPLNYSRLLPLLVDGILLKVVITIVDLPMLKGRVLS